MENDQKKSSMNLVSNWWKYGAITVTILFIIIVLGQEDSQISPQWVIVAVLGVIAYQYVKESLLKRKQPSMAKLIKLVQKHTEKKGKNYNFNEDNLLVEPIGRNQWAVKISDEGISYLVQGSIVYGRSEKSILELQQENDKSDLKRILAEKGIVEAIEE